MKTKKTFILMCCISILYTAKSQSLDSTKQFSRPFQFTFVYPIGTNGYESSNYDANFSINCIAGYNKSITGLEIGGFANTIKQDLTGIQVAGFSNVVLGKTTGCQFSGFSNYGNKITKGIQASGFSNVINDSATVSQFAGFSNIINGPTMGIQVAGFSNVIHGNTTGSQISGFSNVVTDSAKIIQCTGFCNVVKGKTTGIQVAGFTNVSTNNLEGIQISGFANTVSGTAKGSQIAGFTNICSQDVYGTQISGFINIAKKLNGVQLGFINVCDTVETGLPVGFLSFVRKGYHAFEISVNETGFISASLKTGIPKFYNIFSVGAKTSNNSIYYSYGYGVGTRINVNPQINIDVELASQAITIDWDIYSLNSLSNLELNASYALYKNIEVFGGISYNVFVTDQQGEDGKFTDNGIVPWSNFNREYRDVLVKMYPGAHLGINFTF